MHKDMDMNNRKYFEYTKIVKYYSFLVGSKQRLWGYGKEVELPV